MSSQTAPRVRRLRPTGKGSEPLTIAFIDELLEEDE